MTIPRLLHYCWVGGADESEEMARCLATWSRVLPDYEIVRWDESNLPTDRYVERALALGLWARASNGIRLHALYEHGGIYLDTDVEVVRSFDHLLELEAFTGFQYEPDGSWLKPFKFCVASGVMGAVAGHPIIRSCLDRLPRDLPDDEAFAILGPQMLTAELAERGLDAYVAEGTVIDGMAILPTATFYPYYFGEPYDPSCVGPDTLSIHHWAKRW